MLDRLPPVAGCALLTVMLSGCGRPVGQVGGKITLKDQPVARADIVFQSQADAKEEYFGSSSADGVYYVTYRARSGMKPGRYLVTVTRYTQPNGKPLPEDESGQVMRDNDQAVKHEHYFDKDIVAGANVVDFELSQGRSKK